MRTVTINKYLEKAAYFRRLADPEENWRICQDRDGATTMNPERAAQRAAYWEDRAALLFEEGLAADRARAAVKEKP